MKKLYSKKDVHEPYPKTASFERSFPEMYVTAAYNFPFLWILGWLGTCFAASPAPLLIHVIGFVLWPLYWMIVLIKALMSIQL